MKKILLSLFVIYASAASAQIPAGAADFCKESNININSKKAVPVKEHVKDIAHLGNTYFAENAKDCEFIKTKRKDMNSVLIDARGKGTRGVVRGAVTVSYTHLTLPTTPYV